MTITFVTVCVGKKYIDYFNKVFTTYVNKLYPREYNLRIYTDEVDYCDEYFWVNSDVIEAVDFKSICLDKYGITTENYRDNDCIKMFSFCDALKHDKSELLVYVDGDMLLSHFNEDELKEQFAYPGFYFELCHEYNSFSNIDDHIMKRYHQCRGVIDNVYTMKYNDKLIFPIERYWALKRDFNEEKERAFRNEFVNLFNRLIENHKGDLYTEAVEMGHCFTKAFGNNNYKIEKGLLFTETAALSDIDNSEMYNALTS